MFCTDRETLQALFERLAAPNHTAVMQRSDPMERAAVPILRLVGGARLLAEYHPRPVVLEPAHSPASPAGRAHQEGPDGC